MTTESERSEMTTLNPEPMRDLIEAIATAEAGGTR